MSQKTEVKKHPQSAVSGLGCSLSPTEGRLGPREGELRALAQALVELAISTIEEKRTEK